MPRLCSLHSKSKQINLSAYHQAEYESFETAGCMKVVAFRTRDVSLYVIPHSISFQQNLCLMLNITGEGIQRHNPVSLTFFNNDCIFPFIYRG